MESQPFIIGVIVGSFFTKLFGIKTDASIVNKVGAVVNWTVIGGAVAAVATGHAPTVNLDLSSVSGAVTSALVLGIAELYRRSNPGAK